MVQVVVLGLSRVRISRNAISMSNRGSQLFHSCVYRFYVLAKKSLRNYGIDNKQCIGLGLRGRIPVRLVDRCSGRSFADVHFTRVAIRARLLAR